MRIICPSAALSEVLFVFGTRVLKSVVGGIRCFLNMIAAPPAPA